MLTVAFHSCPSSQIHQTLLFAPAVTSVGFNESFLVGCHCCASDGFTACRSLNPTTIIRPRSAGQLESNRFRLRTAACHSCPSGHCHQTLLFVPAVTSVGFNESFLVGCHCCASNGFTVCKSLKPATVTRPLSAGHPATERRVILPTLRCHSCPSTHCHQTLRFEMAAISEGVSSPFFVGCHWAAVFGSTNPRLWCGGHGRGVGDWRLRLASLTCEVRARASDLSRRKHSGHPLPFLERSFTCAFHSCPSMHCHHTLRFDPSFTSEGVSSQFFVGCHSDARFGSTVAKSFIPTSTTRPEWTGQPFPLTRSWTPACHSCPVGHCHQTLREDPVVTLKGVSSPFFTGCHSDASFGTDATTGFRPIRRSGP